MDPRLKSTKELINYFNGLRAASTTVGAGSGRNLANNNEIYHNKVALNEPQRFLSAKELIKFHESEFARESKTNGSSGSFGVKYSEDTYNIYVSNARSIVNKKKSLEHIFSERDIDVGIINEINTKNRPDYVGIINFLKLLVADPMALVCMFPTDIRVGYCVYQMNRNWN